jgi:hypothetical protein
MQHASWRPDDDEDIALVNGNILTLDGRNTIANSVAIRGDRIVDIGNGRHVRPCKQTIDLRGATVIACMPQAGSPRWRISRGTSHEECNQQGVSATPDPTRLGSIIAQWQTLSGRARVAKPAMN